jgi:tetratricopeptide (TPR) repeat protein/SAM-dependent methyltransferase
MNDRLEKGRGSPDRNSAEVAELFATALQHHQRGDLNKAWDQYQAVLVRKPDHAESLHHLGVIAIQIGRHDLSVELIGRAIGLDDRIAEFHYNIGIAYGSLGRLEQAIVHNRKAIEIKPDYGAAFMNLGKALASQGRIEEAIDRYQRAVALMPDAPEARLGLANALTSAGQLESAANAYLTLLAMNPDDADTQNNFGTLLAAQGKLDQAIVRYEQALRLNPALATAEFNLGNAHRDGGKLQAATEHFRRALRLNPNFADAHNNLGIILELEDRHAEACDCFQRAIAAKPNFAAAYKNLGKALHAVGNLARALEAFRQAMALDDTAETRTLLYTALTDARSLPHAHRYREVLVRALAEPPGEPRELVAAAVSALTENPVVDRCLQRVLQLAPGFEPGDLKELGRDQLLLALLISERSGSEQIEQLLTAMRAALLNVALRLGPGAAADEDMLTLNCALARHCFLTEYVFAVSDRELEHARTLQTSIAEALKPGSNVPVKITAMWIAAAASYAALLTLPDPEVLRIGPWPAPLDAVIQQQIAIPREIQRVAAAIPRLTPIDDEISLLVARQYEDSPYPRWEGLPVKREADVNVGDYLRARFPAVPAHLEVGSEGCDYLIAGCGTGRHAATMARLFGKLRVTAIDLSKASLGYAKYKTDSLGLTDIAYGQADILAIRTIEKTFDVIDSVGVLHHMADPQAGWRALLGVLRLRGCMRIGLYSEIGRRHIVAARRLIAEWGYGQSDDEIRQSRQDLLACSEGSPEREATKSWDFYSLSECRDLLFHVQEHRLTFPQIGQFLAAHDLELIGLELDAPARQQYGERFPHDKPMTDLKSWHVFEQENPDLFRAMYYFWVQRRTAEFAGSNAVA